MESNTTNEPPGDETDQGQEREPAEADAEALPDPFREQSEVHTLANQFESLPHHPAHILDRLLFLPPIHGLRNLARTVWYRRRNAFYSVMLRRFWGRHPWIMLFLTVVALSFAVVPFEYCLMLAADFLAQWVNPSGTFPFPLHVHIVFSIVPYFLHDPSLYLAALFAWKIRRFNQAPSFDSELAVLPNWRPFFFRSVAVQIIGAAALVTIIGNRAIMLVGALRPSFRAVLLPPGTPPIRWVTYFLGLSSDPTLLETFRSQILDPINWCCYEVIALSFFLMALLRARTVPRMIGFVCLAGYLSSWYVTIIGWLGREIENRVTPPPGIYIGGTMVSRLFELVVHLLVIGTIWHVAYRRVCRMEGGGGKWNQTR